LSDAARAAAKERAAFLRANDLYVRNLDTPQTAKVLRLLYEGPRSTLLTGHGPVIPVTHASDYLLRVDSMHKFLGTWFNATKSIIPKAAAQLEEAVIKHPDYPDAIKSGLKVKPEDTLSKSILHDLWPTKFKAHKSWANNANTAVKLLRLREWSDGMKGVPEGERASYGKLLAESVNHSTGAMSPHEAGLGLLGELTIAPQLVASKWMKTTVDPVRTGHLALKAMEGKATPAERRIIGYRTWRAGKYLATNAGILILNQALLKALGSKQRVNFDDPSRADLWRFKAGGYVINPRGSTEVLQLLARLVYAAKQAGKGRRGGTSPEELLGRYGSYKLHPSVGIARELIAGKDIFGRPVPWSKEPGTRFAPRLEYPEYIAEKGPIFIGGAVHEMYQGMRDGGMSTRDIQTVIGNVQRHPELLLEGAKTAVGEFFGLGIYKDHNIGK
jgi:hypothetical protein